MDQANVLKLVRTKDEQDELINLIETLLANLYKNKTRSKTESLNSPFITNLTNAIYKTAETLKISDNKVEIEKFLNSLLSSVKNLTVLKISIAIEPNQKLIDSLKRWADKNAGNIVFELTVEPKIIGGAIIINNEGEYLDFSLLRKIDDLFLNQKQEILKLL